MFGPNISTSALSITKVLSGVSKALKVANQAIPIYKEIKPVISNARSILSVVKEMNAPTTKQPTKKELVTIEAPNSENYSNKTTNFGNPTFFQ